ncbi:MAG: M24 family metallopeptidase, partial [Actinomycetota bacterium]|nr:M24 family metallopeptidase [Actinomycetota bacterium]
MRRAGEIAAATIDQVLEAVVPGATTLDLDRIAERFIRSEGATP